jgi:hypothetical protein
MGVRVRVDLTKLEFFMAGQARRVGFAFDEWQQQGSNEAAAILQANTPVRSGFMRSSIVKNLTSNGFSVYPTASYTAAVEFGTKPHTIFPSKKKVLKWTGGGGSAIFAMRVLHPGFVGRFFIRKSRDELRDKLRNLYLLIWRKQP